MRLILGFVLGLTGAALFLSGVDHQAVTRELRAWFEGPGPAEAAAQPMSAAETLPVPVALPSAPSEPQVQSEAGAETQEAAQKTVPEPALERAEDSARDSPTEIEPDDPIAESQLNWEPIWRPFKAPSAASGFAARLAAMTGQTYRVRPLDDQAYQVELAYRSEEERRVLIERVRALTGLELGADRP